MANARLARQLLKATRHAPPPPEMDDRTRRAWLAVQEFQRMRQSLTSFARAATGIKNVTVQLATNVSSTDGKNIWIYPPIALGDRLEHNRMLCDKLDSEGRQRCEACAARESVTAMMCHEIGHVAYGSFEKPKKEILDRVCAMIEELHPAPHCQHAWNLQSRAVNEQGYIAVVRWLSPYLPALIDGLEDARVNARSIEARPGLRRVFRVRTEEIFGRGIPKADGSRPRWSDAPLNSQMVIGTYLMASGYEIKPGYLKEEVRSALKDPVLEELAFGAVRTSTATQIADLTLDVYRRLNEMGFCVSEPCDEAFPSLSMPGGSGDGDLAESDDTPGEEEQDDNASGSSAGSFQPAPGTADGSPPSDQGNQGDNADMDPDSRDAEGSSDSGSQRDPGGAEADPGTDGDDRGGAGEEGETSETQGDQGSDPGEDGPGGDRGDLPDQGEGSSDSETPAPSDGDGGEGDTGDVESVDQDDSGDGPSGPGGEAPGDHDDESDDRSVEAEGSSSGVADEQGSDSDEDAGTGGKENDGVDDPVTAPSGGSDAQDQVGDGDGGRQAAEDSDATEDADGASTASGEWSPDADSDAESDPDGKTDADDPDDPDDADYEGEEVDASESVWDNPGTPDEVAQSVRDFGIFGTSPRDDDAGPGSNHNHSGQLGAQDVTEEDLEHIREELERRDQAAVALAAVQAAHFDSPRVGIKGLDVVQYPNEGMYWLDRKNPRLQPPWEEYMPRAASISPAIIRARIVLEANRQSKHERSLRGGPRLDGRALGKRIPVGDDRLFRRKTIPGRHSHFFLICVDTSGSTRGGAMQQIKRAVMAQAEVLHSLGHSFAIVGMSSDEMGEVCKILMVKDAREPWNPETKTRLANLYGAGANLDGHNFEYARKFLDSRTEVTRTILYYTDGKMPYWNFDEELWLMQHELNTISQRGYYVLAAGMGTDSPKDWGLPTVVVESDADVIKVVNQLGEFLQEE